MKTEPFLFPSGNVDYHFEGSLAEDLSRLAPPQHTIIITDKTVAGLHGKQWDGYRSIIIEPGEASKTWETVQHLTHELIKLEAHRGTMLVGIGGGVITDVTGMLASVYMRGLSFGFVPTTLLATVDAAIGGKNGVNVSVHKNMIGTIRQPGFILFDLNLLSTLPDEQWSNGFAEVIKYGFIADSRILTMLQKGDVAFYQKHLPELEQLIEGCVDLKSRIVNADEKETGLRKTLNFGHTAGHAFETLYGLPHGHAVGLGMMIAISLSERHAGVMQDAAPLLKSLLERFGLPTSIDMDPTRVLEVMAMDKKRTSGAVDYVLIEKPGVAVVKSLTLEQIGRELHSKRTMTDTL